MRSRRLSAAAILLCATLGARVAAEPVEVSGIYPHLATFNAEDEAAMFGRHTGNARRLTDPARKIYCATMEEGIYEVDVQTLAPTRLFADEQEKATPKANLPGYHGKGLYSGQGRVVYANNGDHATEALAKPDVPSGVLAEWDGKADTWTFVRRNQFTEVNGPGGIWGNADPATA